MLKNDQYQIQEEFGNQTMPHQLRVTHIATGVTVVGNCMSETSKSTLLAELVAKLEGVLPVDAAKDVDAEKAELRRQLAAMQAQIDKLNNRQDPRTYIDAPKKRGRPKGYKVVKKVAPKETPTHPEGYSVLDPTKIAPPAPSLPEHRSYKPGRTVAVSNVKDVPA